MPLSSTAYVGLRAAIHYNPERAGSLLDALRSFPGAVKYRPENPYGPLTLMLTTVTGSLAKAPPKPLPQEQLDACRVFNEEWLRHDYTKQELADAIQKILAEMPSNS